MLGLVATHANDLNSKHQQIIKCAKSGRTTTMTIQTFMQDWARKVIDDIKDKTGMAENTVVENCDMEWMGLQDTNKQ